MSAIIYEAWVSALVLGHLYACVLLGLLYVRVRTSTKEAEGNEKEDKKKQKADNTHASEATAGGDVPLAVLPRAPTLTKRVDSPIRLDWENVSVTFSNAQGKPTTVLQGQSGEALPGEMLAVMGPSGAGKSTLMDVLSARALRGAAVHGAVRVNGRPMSAADFVHLRAYVPQEDHFVPSMTAIEAVMLHMSLELPAGTPSAEVAARGHEVLSVMGLSHHQHTLCGGLLPGGVPLRGLSGGQKRRLNIACHIAAAPPVIFLDEPTSGLDSTAALKVMSYMTSFTASGHTIIATLHQPRAAIWLLLDKVLFVAFGRMLYLGTPDGVLSWFSGSLGYPYEASRDGLPSDWVMDLAAPDMAAVKQEAGEWAAARVASRAAKTGRRVEERGESREAVADMRAALEVAAERFAVEWQNRQKAAAVRGTAFTQQPTANATGSDHVDGSNGDGAIVVDASALDAPVSAMRPSMRTWLHELRVLLAREGLMITRNPADAAGRMITCMYTSVLEEGTSFQSRLGLLFINLVFVGQLPFVNMGLLLSDSWLLIREAAENMYSPSACYVARMLINTVFNTCNAVVYTAVTYGLVGLRRGADHFWVTCGVQILCHLIMCQVMAFGAVALPTQDSAFMLAVGVVATFILLANFLIRWQEVTWAWVAALRFISPLYYGFGTLVHNEFAGRTVLALRRPRPARRASQTATTWQRCTPLMDWAPRSVSRWRGGWACTPPRSAQCCGASGSCAATEH